MKIGRTLLWFKDGDMQLTALDQLFFPLGILMRRLLNEQYNGKAIKFINISFLSSKTYELYPVIPRDDFHYYNGHLNFNGTIDFQTFNNLSENEQANYLWEASLLYLQRTAILIKNEDLLIAVKYAHTKGLEINLNSDYRVVEKYFEIKGLMVRASVWINFERREMTSKFTLEVDHKEIFTRDLDRSGNGIEFFLTIYKDIDYNNGIFIIKGSKDVDYLPLKIVIPHETLQF